MSDIVSRKYSPKDFSAGQVHELLITLGKCGLSPSDLQEVANNPDKAKMVVEVIKHGNETRRKILVITRGDDHVLVDMGNASGSFSSAIRPRPLEELVDQAIGWAVRHCKGHGLEINIKSR